MWSWTLLFMLKCIMRLTQQMRDHQKRKDYLYIVKGLLLSGSSSDQSVCGIILGQNTAPYIASGVWIRVPNLDTTLQTTSEHDNVKALWEVRETCYLNANSFTFLQLRGALRQNTNVLM